MRAAPLLALVLLAGCATPSPDASPEATPTPTAPAEEPPSSAEPGIFPPTATVPPTDQGRFDPRIYFRDPQRSSLAHEEGAATIRLPPGGFDLSERTLVHAEPGGKLVLTAASGKRSTLAVPDLRHLARPSLAPDGTRVVVQATQGEPEDAPPANLDIFIVDIATGKATRIAGEAYNEESPEWFPDGTRIAYSSFSPTEGVDLHVHDLANKTTSTFDDAGAIHLAIFPDGTRILEPGRARILDAATGAIVADLREKVVAAAADAGWRLDERYRGQADRGTFPLDGDVSPDGTRLVFDGAVERGGVYGVLLFTVNSDGSGFRAIAGPFPVDPNATNGLNYSETNPAWL